MRTIVALLALLALTGCMTAPDADLASQAYTAGQLTAAVYVDTQDSQPENVQLAAKVAYRALVRVTGGEPESMLESIISEELAKTDSAVAQVVVMSYYNTAKQKLSERLDVELNTALLKSFRAGVDSVLEAYNQGDDHE